ncbi:hypothetical protein Bbelb_292960 [Branchiostoma belcheri]|nr:hypothetical protein Bbelb_292960 [Branchiostoma belcheri]
MLDCASSPCAHGTCTDGGASYTCSCENGWTGANCDRGYLDRIESVWTGDGGCDVNSNAQNSDVGSKLRRPLPLARRPCALDPTHWAFEQQVYLTRLDTWAFYKVLVVGQMTGANVKTTCEAVGMRYPCRNSGTVGCTRDWTSDCITYDGTVTKCGTLEVLSSELCGINISEGNCQPLDDTFVYAPDFALGVDYDTHSNSLSGIWYGNKYALCADMLDCASSPCVHGTCADGVASYTCSCENGWTGTNCDKDTGSCAD